MNPFFWLLFTVALTFILVMGFTALDEMYDEPPPNGAIICHPDPRTEIKDNTIHDCQYHNEGGVRWVHCER